MKSNDERWRYVEILSELRANYSCFEENEEPYYKALSVGIKAIRDQITHDSDLDKIKAEIDEYKDDKIIHSERNEMIDTVLDIIDQYKAEAESEVLDAESNN